MIANHGTPFDKGMVTDIAMTTNTSTGHHVGKSPNVRIRTDRGRFVDESFGMDHEALNATDSNVSMAIG